MTDVANVVEFSSAFKERIVDYSHYILVKHFNNFPNMTDVTNVVEFSSVFKERVVDHFNYISSHHEEKIFLCCYYPFRLTRKRVLIGTFTSLGKRQVHH